MALNRQFWGCVFLVSGTCIGAATLALPIVLLDVGYQLSILFFIATWVITWLSGHMLVEVSLFFPPGAHLIRMVHKVFGPAYEGIVCFFYLLLLYSLLALYLTGMGDLFQGVFSLSPLFRQGFILIEVVLGAIVLMVGIRRLAQLNDIVMISLLLAFVSLFFILGHHAHWQRLLVVQMPLHSSYVLPVIATAFGYQVIIPTLRLYASGRVNNLRQVIFYGSLLPLFLYIAWISNFFAVVPHELQHQLIAEQLTQEPAKLLPKLFIQLIHNTSLTYLIDFFIAAAILTSFLGIAVSLKDFIIDSMAIFLPKKKSAWAVSMTLLPPTLFALFVPNGFVWSLRYAGAFVALLNILCPALLWYCLIYQRKIVSTLPKSLHYVILISLCLFAFCILFIDFFHGFL